MVDMASIQGAISGLQSVRDIAKSFVGLRDTALIQGKVVELQEAILAAQANALDAQADQTAMAKRIDELEKDLTGFETWDAEKQRYKLMRCGSGMNASFAYVLKQSEAHGEPGHAICATCYEQRTKSILQSNGKIVMAHHAWVCPNCKSEVKTLGNPLPEFAN